MSYSKTTWQNGNIVTAAAMNKIENGIDNVTTDLSTLTKAYFKSQTFKTIESIHLSGNLKISIDKNDNKFYDRMCHVTQLVESVLAHVSCGFESRHGTNSHFNFHINYLFHQPLRRDGQQGFYRKQLKH